LHFIIIRKLPYYKKSKKNSRRLQQGEPEQLNAALMAEGKNPGQSSN
jgi:hypothetical protein